jgi:hypothetical protein
MRAFVMLTVALALPLSGCFETASRPPGIGEAFASKS